MIHKHFDEIPTERIERPGFRAMTARFALTLDDGMPHYALRIMEFGPGGHTSLHAHAEEHEFYFLDSNSTLVNGEGVETPMREGDCVYVSAHEMHQIKNPGSDTARVVCTIPILPGGDGKRTTQTACGVAQ